jgi:hypothetical protein
MDRRKECEELANQLKEVIRHSAEVTTIAIDAGNIASRLASVKLADDPVLRLSQEMLVGKIGELEKYFHVQMKDDYEALIKLAKRIGYGRRREQ